MEHFEQELSFIKNEQIRNITSCIIENLVPKYFFEVAASSTGKYHPNYALGEGGLLRHTKAAVKIAKSLFTIMEFDLVDEDYIISALILHDSFKHGVYGGKYTKHDHPVVAAEQIKMFCDTLCSQTTDENDIKRYIEYGENVSKLVASHMGQWNTCKYDRTVLPLPETTAQRFVHMCDYLASRKFIEIIIDEE